MSMRKGLSFGCVLLALTLLAGHTSAAKKAQDAKPALSEAGQRALAKYTAMLEELRAELAKSLPVIPEQKKAAFLKAHQNEFNAAAAVSKALAATRDKSAAAHKQERADALKAAQDALAPAKAGVQPLFKAVMSDLERTLASDALDAKLVKATVLAEATPHGLAAFAQQSSEHEALVDKLLANTRLMKEMLIAGGAREGQYGRAMQIYTAIQQTSPRASQGLFARLALATSLEHAVPIEQENARAAVNAPTIVDPVKRYMHYEKAYLDGELDAAFKDLNAWEYRMVVNCDAPDEILAWGRNMLRTYRPDQVYTPNYGWRYSESVRSDVTYGSQNVKDDLPTLHEYQNIPMNGGVCGRRAFYGRFILKSFGIPSWGVTQHAHAALSHWTPDGWVINLGASWQWSWWDHEKERRSGTDFFLETQAREHENEYIKALRAQWISDALGEQAYNDRMKAPGGFWSALAHQETVAIAAASKAGELGPLGEDVSEVDETKQDLKAEQLRLIEADRRIVQGAGGLITIPAAGSSKPQNSKGNVTFMKSFPDGMQIFFRPGREKLEYTVEVPRAGKYLLSVKVATLQADQTLLLTMNDQKQPTEIAVPHTVGLWQPTAPMEVMLNKGTNVLRFARPDKSRGVSIKEITLTPGR